MKKIVLFLLLPALLILSFAFFHFTQGHRSSSLQDRKSNVNITVLLVSQQNMENLKNDISDLETEVDLNKHTAFVLYLNTHSVDLSQVDLRKLSYFQVGGRKYKPIAYNSYMGSGMMAAHHMKGLLLFDKIDEREGDLLISGVGDKSLRKYRIILR